MIKKTFLWLQCALLVLSALTTSSCNRLKSTEQRIDDLISNGAPYQFTPLRLDSGQFNILSFHNELGNAKTVDVFIEGDGLAWLHRGVRGSRLSDDPTPLNSITFKLALNSSHKAIYLARPCQYQAQDELEQCHPRYWSSHRYATEVVESLDKVLSHYKTTSSIQHFRLLGYSGGGTLAVLLAAKRDDVRAVMTMAANLDHEFWMDYHQLPHLSGSLNAADVAASVKHIPQFHIVGRKDKIIPESVLERYIEQSGEGSKIQKRILEKADHSCCWLDYWPELEQQFDRMSAL